MKRPITIASGQFGDLSLEELCKLVSSIGYEGIEIACQAHINVHKVLEDDAYVAQFRATLEKYGLKVWALGAHLIGQCVGDNWDPRLDNFAPNALSGKPDEIRAWAVEEMKTVARAAQKLGIKVVTCFLGSPIWAYWYSFPQTPQSMVEAGFARIKELWTPIFDVYDECGVKLALEVHPTEIAFDYYSTKKLLDTLEWRPTLGLNFDPSHLFWQGIDPVYAIRYLGKAIYFFHAKDTKIDEINTKTHGVLDTKHYGDEIHRSWIFRSVGYGHDYQVWKDMMSALRMVGYDDAISIEHEDSLMTPNEGLQKAIAFLKDVMMFEDKGAMWWA